MLSGSIARGIESEYAIAAAPYDPTTHRQLVHRALNVVHDEGYSAAVGWSQADEVGNLGYEQSLATLWSAAEGPYPACYNGMRVYDDAAHFEVSTPVYNSPVDAIRYSQAGEYLLRTACRRLSAGSGRVHGYNNNLSTQPAKVGYTSVAYGTHFNVCLRRSAPDSAPWFDLRDALGAYLVTRVILTGGGEVVPVRRLEPTPEVLLSEGAIAGRYLRFALSARPCFMTNVMSRDTMVERGMVNTRDEPFARPDGFLRYHDINNDALRCPFHIYLRDVLQTYVFAAFERGLLAGAPRLYQPVEQAVALTLDTEDLAWRVQLAGGSTVDAVTDVLQGCYLDAIAKMVDAEGDEVDRRNLAVLDWTLDRLAARDLDALDGGLDWVTKRNLIREYAGGPETMIAVCNQFSYVDDSIVEYVSGAADRSADGGDFESGDFDSLFDLDAATDYAAERLPWLDWDGLPARVRAALSTPPDGTREYLRGALLRRFDGQIDRVSWDRIYLRGGEVISFPDPLLGGREQVGDRLDGIAGVAGLDRLGPSVQVGR